MSDEDRPDITPLDAETGLEPAGKPRVKKLRLLAILAPLSLLAVVSTVFGMMMAVASDLPDLENRAEYRAARNSVLYDVRHRRLGVLTSNQNRILAKSSDISLLMKNAIIAIEDKRFRENSGVDLRGIGRAFFQDVVQKKAAQGGSTITQQFVKNALQAQSQRTLFQKLREAALAYHLTRKWSKDKILTEYLNSIYFGNGAYGVEAAARTYFGNDPNHIGCGVQSDRPCAKELAPQEAALLAGIISSPSAYDPVANQGAALARRDLVLDKMVEQGSLTAAEAERAKAEALPAPENIRPPRVPTLPEAKYFATWVRQALVDKLGARRAFEGGLQITTTLDLDLQHAAEQAIANYPMNPSAALVAIDNDTGAVRAMVGGRDYDERPFNLATQGQRQPGSAFKPFILAEALHAGIGPGSVWPSRKREFVVPGTGRREHFVVNNFEDSYAGQRTLASALTWSDNSVFAAVGIHVGTKKVAAMAQRMGIRTPVSNNYAMTLGGLREGVTPLDMAHAYETIAADGNRITGTLGAGNAGPVGIRRVKGPDGKTIKHGRNHVVRIRVLAPSVAALMKQIMATVVTTGTGRRAGYGEFAAGKTGTTENYGDAWFVGFNDKLTVAVWVGYPDTLRSMKTDFNGGPVEGGTWPALIWHDFAVATKHILDDRAARARAKQGLPPIGASGASGTTGSVTPTGKQTAPGAGAKPTRKHKSNSPSTGGEAPKSKAAPAPATPPTGENTGGAEPPA